MEKMRITLLILIIVVAASIGLVLFSNEDSPLPLDTPGQPQSTGDSNQTQNAPDIQTVVTGLDTPWAIAFLPDGQMLVTERPGTIQLVNIQTGNKTQVGELDNVLQTSESGLHGIALHPDFEENNFVYLYYTYRADGGNTLNRVSRFTFSSNRLSNEQIMVDQIPGAPNHDGGRIKFGPDTYLYISTGDAQEPSLSQNRNSLAGKILRVTDSGQPAPGNPFNNRTYSYGHRNPQGIAWDGQGNLWATEHGRSGVQSGLDELNLIKSGSNYGWPEIEGDEVRSGMIAPIRNSGSSTTWAPAGIAIINNQAFFGGLRGRSLYSTTLDGENAGDVRALFEDEYGRIREVIAGPDNMLYITTSNRDGRGNPKDDDDKIIRINPERI